MDERVMQFRVGLLVLATLLITAILVTLFSKAPTMLGRYPITIKFTQAPGVTEGTPVRVSGVLIGRVSRVDLADEDRVVVVTAEIYNNRRVYENQDCYVVRELLGDTALQFVPSPGKPGENKPIPPGAVVEGKVSEDVTGLKRALEAPINTVVSTGVALTEASNELKAAAKQVRDMLKENETDVRTVIQRAGTTLEAVGKAANSANNLIGDEETQLQLRKAMQRLPDTLDSLNRTIHLAETSLQNLQKFTAPLGAAPEQRARQMLDTIDQLSHITVQLRAFTDRLASPNGTLGQLIDNPELYQHLNRAAKNIDEISRQLKPVVADARAFTDKVSRHPGVIVRDAIHPGPGIK